MSYQQITTEERYTIACLRRQKKSLKEIAEHTGRHLSTVYREFHRNECNDGHYRAEKARSRTAGRRSRSRKKPQFNCDDWEKVEPLIREDWSPDQVANTLKKFGELNISHESIYQHIWLDKACGGDLHKHLRCASKQRRKRYGSYDSRGRLANKRHITERPEAADTREEFGHWEIDTVMGTGSKDCILTLVERKTGWTLIGKLPNRTTEQLNKRLKWLIQCHPGCFKTITADNGTEFHGYEDIERITGVKFYFCTPYHSWERGLNENTNGLIRQYLPKGTSMAHVTQKLCNDIAKKLNNRPRKRLNYSSPMEQAILWM